MWWLRSRGEEARVGLQGQVKKVQQKCLVGFLV